MAESKAVTLAARAAEYIRDVIDVTNKAMFPDPAWSAIHAPQVCEQKLAQQKEAAKETNLRSLRYIRGEVEREFNAVNDAVELTLRPLLFASDAASQRSGRHYEERAFRFVGAVGPMRVEGEYTWAVRNRLTDYATELVRWSEALAKTDEERKAVASFKRRHIERLDLGAAMADRDLLQVTLEELQARTKMVTEGAGNLYTRAMIRRMTQEEVSSNLEAVNRSMAYTANA